MSKASFAIVPFILIILLTAFFYLSPRFFAQETKGSEEVLKELLVRRFINVGNIIAHATFVEDALIMQESAKLNEIIDRFRKDEPTLTFIHFTDAKNKVITSGDPTMIGKTYSSTLLNAGPSVVKERNGTFDGGFSITIGKTPVGALYFGVRPEIPTLTASTSPSPMVLVVGCILAIITFIIMYSMGRGLEARIVDGINRRQEEVFSPKIEALKKEQQQAQRTVTELTDKIAESKKTLESLTTQYEAQKSEMASSPAMQSVEKLKGSEAELLANIERLRAEEQNLTKEISVLSQKHEEVKSLLEAEKKEESTLHEKLDLIKKKILHLETPKK